MEFGKVAPETIQHINFTLPPDGAQTDIVLNGNRKVNPKFFVGCAKWGRKEWINLIYPAKTKEKDFLKEYVKHFNSIELNSVFYGIPKEEQVLKWKAIADAREDFVFCPKFSKSISHIKRLSNAEVETDLYLKSILLFGDKLGPCFLQLSDNFGPKQLGNLEKYLIHLPTDLSLFVEVRHEDWFKTSAKQELFAMLSDRNIGAVITDASGRRDVAHMEVTVPKTFVRFVGNGGRFLDSDKLRIDNWIDRLQQWLDKGLEELYFFLHQHDETDTPVIADYTIEQFNKRLGGHLPRLTFQSRQTGLF